MGRRRDLMSAPGAEPEGRGPTRRGPTRRDSTGDAGEAFSDFYADEERARHYRDKFAADRVHRAADRAERAAIAGLLGRCESRGTWLDMPSGAGRFESAMADAGLKFVAADASFRMLVNCRSRDETAAKPPIGCVRVDAFALPFAAKSFDGVLCSRFLHHFADPDMRIRALEELRRVVRSFAIVTYFDRASYQAARRSWRARHRNRSTGRHAQSRADLVSEAEAAGFQVAEIRYRARFISEWAVALLKVGMPRGS